MVKITVLCFLSCNNGPSIHVLSFWILLKCTWQARKWVKYQNSQLVHQNTCTCTPGIQQLVFRCELCRYNFFLTRMTCAVVLNYNSTTKTSLWNCQYYREIFGKNMYCADCRILFIAAHQTLVCLSYTYNFVVLHLVWESLGKTDMEEKMYL